MTAMSGGIRGDKAAVFETSDPRYGMHIIPEQKKSQKHSRSVK